MFSSEIIQVTILIQSSICILLLFYVFYYKVLVILVLENNPAYQQKPVFLKKFLDGKSSTTFF